MTISCRSRQFKVHKAIICRRSDLFLNLCNAQSSRHCTIDLTDEDPILVKRAIRYLYKLNYLTKRERQIRHLGLDPRIHAGMVYIGHKLGIPSLQEGAEFKFTKWLENRPAFRDSPSITPLFDYSPEGTPTIPPLFSRTKRDDFPHNDLALLVDLISIIWRVQAEQTLDLRDLLLDFVTLHLEDLTKLPGFNALLHSGSGFARNLLDYRERHF